MKKGPGAEWVGRIKNILVLKHSPKGHGVPHIIWRQNRKNFSQKAVTYIHTYIHPDTFEILAQLKLRNAFKKKEKYNLLAE